ncbi:Flavin-linked sulfhydryl oxidase of the mitochondrial IMS [Friedmanniomyces endolithicus]|nr:Flavin-linked sulfhydryl oxidase of the mitochondrial IMS [Friedmanniomyces endolithicus]
MPLTEIQYPILQVFLCVVESRTGMPAQPLNATPEQLARAGQKQDEDKAKPLPKGVVLGPDGKPYASTKLSHLHVRLFLACDDQVKTSRCCGESHAIGRSDLFAPTDGPSSMSAGCRGVGTLKLDSTPCDDRELSGETNGNSTDGD